ncbi:MAG: inositol monophosphatase family protein [Planctomycetota bacterium]|nr:inositol monophosphatase family protein [Planctomycetota bacterium]
MNQNSELDGVLAKAEELAVGAGKILLDWSGRLSSDQIGSKSAKRDLVTEADLASEAYLLKHLGDAFPSDAFLAEESANEPMRNPNAESMWCIDPLDGTVNFVHELPMFAVSIARLRRGVPEVAVVHLPRLGETFTAIRGGGAFLNGKSIQVSNSSQPLDSLFATGFPYRRHLLADNNLENFNRMFLHQRGIRRMGSAAIDLAYVAAGRIDAFWEMHLSPWDVAAAGLLVQEAGGVVDTLRPGGDWVFDANLIAGPTKLVEATRQILAENRGDDFPNLGDRES